MKGEDYRSCFQGDPCTTETAGTIPARKWGQGHTLEKAGMKCRDVDRRGEESEKSLLKEIDEDNVELASWEKPMNDAGMCLGLFI